MLRGTQGVKRCVRLPRWDTVLCKRSHRSRIQPLSHRWFLIKDIKALVYPFAVLRSRFGLRYSRVRGRRQSKFLALSSTGGARNFYPCTGEPRSALSRRSATLTQGSRELHLIAAVALPLQNVPRPAAHLNISPKGEIFHTRKARISPRRRRDFTRQRSCRISLRLAETLTPCSSPSARKSRCRA